jgi:hypothetical protein
MTANIDRAWPYDRAACKWRCCECNVDYVEGMMSIISPNDRKWWLSRYDEPDWVCVDCLAEATADGSTYTEYCKDCWHVMELDRRAQFHGVGGLCPLQQEG